MPQDETYLIEAARQLGVSYEELIAKAQIDTRVIPNIITYNEESFYVDIPTGTRYLVQLYLGEWLQVNEAGRRRGY